MEPLVRTTPDEASALAMENELLRYETIHLRARLAAAEKAVTKAERALESAKAGQSDPSGGKAAPAAPSAEEATAREDLVWLLERLDRSPAGPLLRGRAGFRTLRARYLDGATG